MIRAPIIMAAVAVLLIAVGAALLIALFRARSPAKQYVFRMTGIMALAGGVMLAVYASAMWRWQAGS